MANKEKCLIIGLAFDESYFSPLLINLISIFENNKNCKIQIHAITKISRRHKEKLKRFVNGYNGEIFFYGVNSKLIKSFAVSNETRYPESVYYRLFLPLLIPESIKKIIYLDIDTLVINPNLIELYNMDTSPFPLAAALDTGIIRPDLGISEEGKYFNSGVMLINIKIWKELNITKKAIDYIHSYPERILFHDQDALNGVLINNWHKVDNRFNLTIRDISLLPQYNHSEFLKGIVVIHYNDQIKPWAINCRYTLKYLFDYYAFKFFRTDFGNSLLSQDINVALFCVSLSRYANQEYSTEDSLLFALMLHLVWIRAIKEAVYYIDVMDHILPHYYNNGLQIDNSIVEGLINDFHNNKETLMEIRAGIYEINDTQNNDENDFGLEMWFEVCQYNAKEIFIKKTTEKLKKVSEISSFIDNAFLINGTSKYFVNYIINNLES